MLISDQSFDPPSPVEIIGLIKEHASMHAVLANTAIAQSLAELSERERGELSHLLQVRPDVKAQVTGFVGVDDAMGNRVRRAAMPRVATTFLGAEQVQLLSSIWNGREVPRPTAATANQVSVLLYADGSPYVDEGRPVQASIADERYAHEYTIVIDEDMPPSVLQTNLGSRRSIAELHDIQEVVRSEKPEAVMLDSGDTVELTRVLGSFAALLANGQVVTDTYDMISSCRYYLESTQQ